MKMIQKMAMGITSLQTSDVTQQEIEDKIMAPLKFFQNVIFGIISAAGTIIFALGIIELIGELSSQRRDVSTIMSAVFRILGGGAMAAIGIIVLVFIS